MTPDSPAPADRRIEEIRRRLADNPDSEGGTVRDVEWVARQCKIAELAAHLLAAYDQMRAGRETWHTKALEMEADRDATDGDLSKVMADRDRWLATAKGYEAAIGVLAPENDRVGGENERLRAERDVLTATVQLQAKSIDRLTAQVQRVNATAHRMAEMASDDREDPAAVAFRHAASWIRTALGEAVEADR